MIYLIHRIHARQGTVSNLSNGQKRVCTIIFLKSPKIGFTKFYNLGLPHRCVINCSETLYIRFSRSTPYFIDEPIQELFAALCRHARV